MDGVEANGKTIDDAIAKALNQLGLNRDEVEVEVLSEARLFEPRKAANPLSEPTIRRTADELARGEPNYDLLTSGMQQVTRAQLAALQQTFQSLGAIESEAARSLTELRALVGALRDDEPAELAPQAGADAIEALVREVGERAHFELEGALEPLAPSVGLALHRIARESLHNIQKHARSVSRIDVRLLAERESVRLVVRDDGEPTRSTEATHGDDWSWIDRVRPPVVIEGITCTAFLDWAARESGRSWRFADPGASSDAGAAIVHGSIDGLSLDEALETVLPSCGLRHRVEGAELVIDAATD